MTDFPSAGTIQARLQEFSARLEQVETELEVIKKQIRSLILQVEGFPWAAPRFRE